MPTTADIIALIGEEKATLVMKLVNSAQTKYGRTAKGRIAKRRSNDNFKAKRREAALDEDIVTTHLASARFEEPQTYTALWKHYSDSYECDAKPTLTRLQYKALLDKLKIPFSNPHIRNKIRYYSPGYTTYIEANIG